MRTMLLALLAVTVLSSIAVHALRWRLPEQPRLALLPCGRRPRRHSPRTELAIELGIITAGCLVLPLAAIGLTVLLFVLASHAG